MSSGNLTLNRASTRNKAKVSQHSAALDPNEYFANLAPDPPRLPTFEEIFYTRLECQWYASDPNPNPPPTALELFKDWQKSNRMGEILVINDDPDKVINGIWHATPEDDEVKIHFEKLARQLEKRHQKIYPNFWFEKSQKKREKKLHALPPLCNNFPVLSGGPGYWLGL